MVLLLLYLALALGVSFLCSLLEAALLSVPQSHLAAMEERGSRAAAVLGAMKRNVDRPLSAILTLNTIAHTVGAAGVGAQAVIVFGNRWVGLTSAILTLLILVLSEIIPKTLGAVYARALTVFTAWTLRWLVIVCYPLVILFEAMNRLIGGRSDKERLSRAEVVSLARMGHDEGVLSGHEASVIRNLLALGRIKVHEVMTPRRVVLALQEDATVGQAIGDQPPPRFARLPVYGRDLDDIRGIVHRYRLFEALHQGRLDQRVGDLAGPVHVIPEHASVGDALEQFMQQRSQLFQVVDEFGGTAGIVTLEDALETLLGTEIVDETDEVVDMRELARRMLAGRRAHREAVRRSESGKRGSSTAPNA